MCTWQLLKHYSAFPSCLTQVIDFVLLFSPLGYVADRDIYYACVNFFFLFLFFFYLSWWSLGEQLSQDPLDRFSQSIHRIKAFWVQMIDLDLFFWYLKGRCRGNQFCGKMANSPNSSLWPFRNGMGYRYLNVPINSLNDASISCKNSWTFGTTRQKNWRIQSNISGYTGPIFAIFTPYESALSRLLLI